METVKAVRELLTLIQYEASVLFADNDGFLPGSMGFNESRNFPEPVHVHDCWTQSVLLIELCGDHVSLFQKGIVEPVEPLAVATCVRSMLESAAIVLWLCDPSIDVNTRIHRSLSLRAEGVRQQINFIKCLKAPTGNHMPKLEARRERLEQLRVRFELPAYKVVGATSQIASKLDMEPLYRALSGVAHGHNGMIQSFAFQGGPMVDDAEIGLARLHKKGFTDGVLLTLGGCISAATFHCLDSAATYCGWKFSGRQRLIESLAKIGSKL